MSRKYIITFVLVAGVFALLATIYSIQAVENWEMKILLGIGEMRTAFLTKTMIFLSYIGSWDVHLGIITVLCFYFVVKGNYSIAVILLFNLFGSRFLNECLKSLFMRERPPIRIVEVAGYSFPSGHAMNNFALFGFFIFLVTISRMKKAGQQVSIGVFIMLIMSISFSRMYLGVHYPTDILAGWCGGSVIILACVYMCRKYNMNIS